VKPVAAEVTKRQAQLALSLAPFPGPLVFGMVNTNTYYHR
jgi:hypothetical protein